MDSNKQKSHDIWRLHYVYVEKLHNDRITVKLDCDVQYIVQVNTL